MGRNIAAVNLSDKVPGVGGGGVLLGGLNGVAPPERDALFLAEYERATI